jgi:RNAse (barnase) inhibitor barstar
MPRSRRKISLIDASVSGALRECCTGARRGETVRSDASLQILDASLKVIGEYYMEVLQCRGCTARTESPAYADGARYDVTLDIQAEGESLIVKEIWQRWNDGVPSVKNLWVDYPPAGRSAWMHVVRQHRVYAGQEISDARPGTTFELDGTHITDRAAFYLALGEAINGPAGYFGEGLDGLEDCLLGSWGARTPFTLAWKSFDVATQYLSKPLYGEDSLCGEPPPGYYLAEGDDQAISSDDLLDDPNLTRPYLDRILEILEGRNVTVARR